MITNSEREKVAHIVLTLNAGGLERLICTLTASEEMRGIEQIVCCIDEAGVLASEVERNGIRVLVEKRGSGFDAGLVPRLAALFRRERITALHTHSLDPMLYAGLAGVLAGVPVRVHTQHNTFLDNCPRKDLWKFRMAARCFTHLVAVSEHTREGMISSGAPESLTRTIVNGIALSSTEDKSAVRDGSRFVVGSVARLAAEKGFEHLLRAFAAFRESRPNAVLRLAGDGPERARLEALSATLGLTASVEFLGFQKNVAAVLGGFDVFVLSSLTEGIPLALLEAMAAGIPVIATAVGGVPEVVVNGVSGLLIGAGDPGAITGALSSLAADDGLRRTLARNGLERVQERFSSRAMAGAYRSVYADVGDRGLKKLGKRILRHFPAERLVWRVEASNDVALTFDDGPDDYTGRILDVLKEYGAAATFFLVGKRIPGNEAVVRRMLDEGHEIGNHSYSHPDFESLSLAEAASELDRAQSEIEGLQGKPCSLFRPPKGKLCISSLLPAWRRRLTVAMWSADFKDFRATTSREILDRARAKPIRPGDIVLYHGNNEAALTALAQIVEWAMGAGNRLVTLSELKNGNHRRDSALSQHAD